MDPSGIVFSDQTTFRALLQKTLRFLGRRTAEDMKNTIFWLTEERQ